MNRSSNHFRLFLRCISNRGVGGALALFIIGLLATTFFAVHENKIETAESKREVDFLCDAIQSKLNVRLAAYEQFLRSGAAFFVHRGGVHRDEWHEFVDSQKISQKLPGIQGMSFALLVPRSRLAQHIQEIRTEGFPEYRVWPEGEREIYTPVIFLDPFTDRNLRVFGYDTFYEPIRRAAMERSRDEDRAVLSGKVILMQETKTGVQAGLLMFMPVYRLGMPHESAAERQSAIFGWVSCSYRMNDLMQGILGNQYLTNHGKIHLKIFDGKTAVPESLLYDSLGSSPKDIAATGKITEQIVINEIGRDWLLEFTEIRNPKGWLHSKVGWISLGGTVISLLLACLFSTWSNTYFNALHMAEQLTSELKRTELEILKVNAELEQRIQERTALLESANSELEAFSYSVSHDLRAPLRAIQGFTTILQEDFAPQLKTEIVRLLNIISAEAKRMGVLIDELLNFSRLSRQPIKQEIVSSNELVQRAREQLKNDKVNRTVDITVANLPATIGDPSLLLQVWINLLSNAIKYTGPRDVAKIEIGWYQEGNEVIYFIKDNGVGFDIQYTDKLFGVFQRLHSLSEFEGSGVGLSLVQRIIHRHGGRIWADAKINEGATFYFSLPGQKLKIIS